MAGNWTRSTRDRWFYILLAISALAVGWLMLPFFDVLLFSAVVVAVAWPWQQKLATKLHGHRWLASIVVTSALGIVIFVPLGLLLYLFVLEGISVAQHGLAWVRDGSLDRFLQEAESWMHGPLLTRFQSMLPEGTDPVEVVSGPLHQVAASILSAASNGLPGLLGGAVQGVIGAFIFVFTVITLLADGERMMDFISELVPIDTRYQRRIVDVFRELSTNLVVGGFMTAAAQGLVAALGLWFFGVPKPLFFGVITAVVSFVPVVGTAVVLGPAVVYVLVHAGVLSAIGLAVYSAVFTGSIDNVLRPFFMRGDSEIHPLLIFLSMFGGMAWIGVTGALIGPVIVASFLSLATIHHDEFVRRRPETMPPM